MAQMFTGPGLPAEVRLTIVGNLSNLQPTSITNPGGFYPSVIEDALDRVTIQTQQLAEATQRTFTFPVSDPALNAQLSTAMQRANKALIFRADGSVSISADDYMNQTKKTADSAAAAAQSAHIAEAAAALAKKKVEEAAQLGTPADNTVSTPKLVKDAVTTSKLADQAVMPDKLADNAVMTEKLAHAVVTAEKPAPDVAVKNIGYMPAGYQLILQKPGRLEF